MLHKTRLTSLLFPVSCCFISASVQAADGDINLDCVVNTVDVLWAQQAVLGDRKLLTEELIQGDMAPLVDGTPQQNGRIDTGDVLLITRIALGSLNYSIPVNQFNIGDSISEGEAADGTIGKPNHHAVWSTGYNAGDIIYSFNERFEDAQSLNYYENNTDRDAVFNHAESGAVMADFALQAQDIVAATTQTPDNGAGLITILLGNNDVCAPTLETMTEPALFEQQYRAGLDVLAASGATRKAQIHVSAIPAIYWLWNANYSSFWCRVFVWPFVPCENLLDNPVNDCVSSISREDPDAIYPGDGPNCQRRKNFHQLIRDTYNPVLKRVLEEYRVDGRLPNARYIDIYNTRFESEHVNGADCFHPSLDGHMLLAEEEWNRTHWLNTNPSCNN